MEILDFLLLLLMVPSGGITAAAPAAMTSLLDFPTIESISRGELLHSGGTIDSSLAGRSDSVNLNDLRAGLADAGSVAVPVAARLAPVPEVSQGMWSALGQGMDGSVNALVVDGAGNVYAGGAFTQAGGATVNRIARWDGTAWSALGTGVTGGTGINALALDDDGNLYVAGNFTTAGGVSVNNIAMWDGMAWRALGAGTGPTGFVYALAVDDAGNVYAGGQTMIIGGNFFTGVAKWDGSAWSPLEGLNGNVFALAIDSADNLYAGGGFAQAGGSTVNNIAVWDGTNWSGLGAGVMGNPAGSVRALALGEADSLFAGGFFTTAGTVIADNVAVWDGSSWSAFGGGIPGQGFGAVLALAQDGMHRLYAGGTFSVSTGAPADYVTVWDGSLWQPLDQGTGHIVRALAADGTGDVYVGGDFSTITGFVTNYVAKWTSEAATAIEPAGPVPGAFHLSTAYPNPFNPQTQFSLTLAAPRRVTITVHDAIGREVARLHEGLLAAGEYRLTWVANGVPSGVYVIRAESDTFSETRRVTLVK